MKSKIAIAMNLKIKLEIILKNENKFENKVEKWE